MSASSTNIDVLFEPLRVGAWDLRNRILVAPMTRNRGVVPTALNAEYYRLRARHGGLIISECILIEHQGSEWPNAPGLFNKDQVRGWQTVTEAVHKEGGLIVAQLWHLGRLSHPLHQAGLPVYGPSTIAAKGGKFRLLPGVPGYQMPRAIEDPEHYVQLFKQAAITAKEANFDGVELQGAGGYLCHQFLDPTANLRTDQWGGSIENRCRFMLRCVDELIDVWGPDRVGVKLQPAGGFNDMGFDKAGTIATFKYLLSELNRRHVAFIEMSQYMQFLDPLDRGVKDLDPATEIAPFFQGAIFLNGGYDQHSGAQAVRQGQAHAITFGRPFLANPDLPLRWKLGLQLNETDWNNVYGMDGVPTEKGFVDYPLINS